MTGFQGNLEKRPVYSNRPLSRLLTLLCSRQLGK